MKLKLKGLAVALCLVTAANAQTNDQPIRRHCGTETPSPEWDAWFNQKVEEFNRSQAANKGQSTTYTIPVVVHVIYGSTNTAVGTFPNISQAQVVSQINVLNADFAGTGLNVGNLAATAFSAVGAADCSISFCLAQLDPNGNFLPEPGIDRVSYVDNNWTNPAAASLGNSSTFQTYMNSTIKPATVWDPNRYFNIWVSDVHPNAQLLGYATFPANSGLVGLGTGGSATTDGIWVWSRAFGSTGTLQSPYNLGRTASHETGHWLGLRHIGGDGNGNPAGDCAATDYCADTPPQKGGYSGGQYGQNFGQPTYPLYATGSNSCSGAPNGNMFMNFMDYVDDPACYMFTPNQAQRMATAMNNGTYRVNLTASSATMCGLSATAPTAMFSATNNACVDYGVELNNQTTGTPPPSYLWSAQPSAGVTFAPNNAALNPTVNFALVGTYNIVLIASNAGGATSYTQTINVDECTPETGIAALSAFQRAVSLAPNPSNGVVDITVASKDIQKLDVEVYSSLGQRLQTNSFGPSTTSKYTLDLSQLSNGVYFIHLSNGSDRAVKRLILNK